jgi:thiamine-phosphate pyrophosphorylase
VNVKQLQYAITDRSLLSRNGLVSDDSFDWQTATYLQAAQLAAEGIDFLQLREKDLPAAELVSLARGLLHIVRPFPIKLLINARADIAVAIRAHGVHLTSSPEELTPRQVHDLYAHAGLPFPVVTVAAHSIEDIVRHRHERISAFLFGPVFEKVDGGEKLNVDATGLDLLHQACLAAAPVPVLALGGVTAENTAECLQAGAGGIAGIRLFKKPDSA